MNGAKTFFDSWYLNNRFLRSSRPLKIRLLQWYVVLWIDNIDVICKDYILAKVCTSFLFYDLAVFQTLFEFYDERYLMRIFCNQKPENDLTRLYEKLALT